jgi:S1-C subfamily serine protease
MVFKNSETLKYKAISKWAVPAAAAFFCTLPPLRAEIFSPAPTAVSGILESFRKVLNPKLAELDKLYTSNKFLEAADFLILNVGNLNDSDKEKYLGLLRPHVETEFLETKRELETRRITPNLEALLTSGREGTKFNTLWKVIEPRYKFFSLDSDYLKNKYNTLVGEWEQASKNELVTFMTTPERFKAPEYQPYQYKQLGQLLGEAKLTALCDSQIKLSKDPRNTEFLQCKSLISAANIASLRLAAANRELELAEAQNPAPFERLSKLIEIQDNWKFSYVEWMSYIEPRLPSLKSVSLDDIRKKTLSTDANNLYAAQLKNEPVQKATKERKQSRYESGSQVLPNPEYLDLQRRHQEVNMEYQNCNANYRAQAIANPYALNFCAFLIPAMNSVRNSLSATSPTLTEVLTTSYEYEVDTLQVTLNGQLLLALYSSSRKDFVYTIVNKTQEKSFIFARNIHPRDTSIRNSSFAKEEQVKDFLATKMTMTYEDYSQFLDNKLSKTGLGSLDKILALNPQSHQGQGMPQSNAKEAGLDSVSAQDKMLTDSVVVVNARGSLGTGFYVQPRYILTNEHVVENQSIVEIELRDATRITGVVIATDSILDLALIAVPQVGKPIEISRSLPKPGQEAFALGHPRGLKFSLTKGVVSAVRSIKVGPGSSVHAMFVQTDVAINQGNSGGPLVVNNQVAGINTFKIGGGGAEGLGFALSPLEIRSWLSKHLPK